MLKPPALQKGDMIGIFAPSSFVTPDRIKDSVSCLEANGYTVFVHPQTFERHHQSAGTPAQKIKALHDLLRDKTIKAIFAASGGNRAGYLLNEIDYNLVRIHPKIITGFSDVTALLTALHRQAGLIGFHGPDMGRFHKRSPDEQKQCMGVLAGETSLFSAADTHILSPGRAQGHLVGGNLSLISSLMGTPFQPDFHDAILFLEDCNDELCRYDRMLLQLKNAGVFERISALIIGDLSTVPDSGSRPFGFTIEEIIHDLTHTYDIPVILNAPFGHGQRLVTLPVGAQATLAVEAKDDIVTLSLNEPAVEI